MKRFLIFLILSSVTIVASSCAFRNLKQDVQVLETNWILDITLKTNDTVEGDVIAVVYSPYENVQSIAAFKYLDAKTRRNIIVLAPGEYRLAIFNDRNKNLMIDADEKVELAEGGTRLKFSEVMKRLDIEVPMPKQSALPKGYPRELASLPESIRGSYHLALGDSMNIKDVKFSADAGRMGLWEPGRFLKEYGSGIYAIDPYDPKKIPVLFVNGAGGSAQNWEYFFAHLDKSKYQAWFFLYPSGMRIAKIGRALDNFIREMAKKYEFPKLYLVAHSMGGLVSREAIVNHLKDGGPLLIDKFITISTPWNGHRMAAKGVEALSTPVPSWHDVVPGSEFLQTVFNTPLKPKVEHHLLFGYQVGSEEDGSVALDSVLLSEAQDDAVEVRGFEGDHTSVLFSIDVFEYVEKILAAEKVLPCKEQSGVPSSPEAASPTEAAIVPAAATTSVVSPAGVVPPSSPTK
jgi:pimeloyl-ACP methyl ester carboxylesterase